jgi:hypothetical protein
MFFLSRKHISSMLYRVCDDDNHATHKNCSLSIKRNYIAYLSSCGEKNSFSCPLE